VAYLIGEREFCGLMLRVTPEVLIPRPETELLVERALARLDGRTAPRVLELGTGSGAIAIALACRHRDAQVWATDISAAAIAVAKANAARHGVKIELRRGDWFDALDAVAKPGARFDLVISNPPYVAAGDPHLQHGDLRFEPRHALVGGNDGLDCIRHIARAARTHLTDGGWLMFEHGWNQGEACAGLMRELAYAEVIDVPDLAGHPRVCEGRASAGRMSAGRIDPTPASG
jgi:release factor glutamine methyltransferase